MAQDSARAAPPSSRSPIAPAERAPSIPSLNLKELISAGLLEFQGINPMLFETPSLQGGSDESMALAVRLISSSDLWKPLTAAYGKCDCMVEGKYHKARLFIFQTESLYIWCATETGDRGTSWFLSDKNQPVRSTQRTVYNYRNFEPNSSGEREVRAFIDALVVGMALAHPPTMDALKGRHVLATASFEARELADQTPAAAPSKQRRLRV